MAAPIVVSRQGTEFLVNTATQSSQVSPTITGLSDGGFVVAWQDASGQGGDASDTSIKAQIYDAGGERVGTEFLVNTETQSYQSAPTITGLSDGGFVVSWADDSGQGGDADLYGIKGQVYDAGGARVGSEFLVNTTTLGFQYAPTIAGLSDGGFVVSWIDGSGQGGDASNSAIKAQVYAAGGARVGTEVLVNTETSSFQLAPAITGLSDGGFVVSWQDFSGQGGDASGWSTKAQLYDAGGARVGSEFLVNTETQSYQSAPTITGLSNGGFVVSWQDLSGQGGDANGYGIKAQVYDAGGARVGSEFLVNTETLNTQYAPTITGLSNGGFVVSWQDASGVASGYGIKAQVYDASGARVGTEVLVNTITQSYQYAPTITA